MSGCRVDRPGFGYSDRPRGAMWTPARQADLIRQACARLGIERPVVVGHSFGTLVALALALDHPDAVSGLVLLSGYYRPTLRADVPLFSLPAIPAIGDLIRYTVGPLFGAALLPLAATRIFSPLTVLERFAKGFPYGLPLRSQRNYTGYCNPELEKLFEQQSMETDQEKRKRLVWEIDRRLQEDQARPIVYHLRFAT